MLLPLVISLSILTASILIYSAMGLLFPDTGSPPLFRVRKHLFFLTVVRGSEVHQEQTALLDVGFFFSIYSGSAFS